MPTADAISTAIPYLALGLLCATGGGELFVRGTVGIARAARVAPSVIAATVAAFATSSPELTVAIQSALAGEPEISLGDALGSNVANLALIFGVAQLFGPLAIIRAQATRNFAAAAAAPLALSVMLIDGSLSRLEAAILLGGFALWFVRVTLEALEERRLAPAPQETSSGFTRALVETSIGLGLLIAAGSLIVFGASGIARRFGLSDFIVGATLVAVGTSTPELATALMARIRRQDDVGFGALLGSNIFNGLFIIGVAGAITPIQTSEIEAAPALIAGLIALALFIRRAAASTVRGAASRCSPSTQAI
ncbi:sodium:calcium antiporter [Methylocystis sp. SC2]|uniref:sodium:calcium antiporter n=1 Tax=Methylocystis sp. (strain SC2) TaxID=187303 RepID=UPI00027AEBFB|nr:sodium:calcium antiporter [Methylocystis sp. SC2]CCJ08674.1 K+-dependent Na+/Ca+ exchanger related-protein [Methylocystis sp. SC2]